MKHTKHPMTTSILSAGALLATIAFVTPSFAEPDSSSSASFAQPMAETQEDSQHFGLQKKKQASDTGLSPLQKRKDAIRQKREERQQKREERKQKRDERRQKIEDLRQNKQEQ